VTVSPRVVSMSIAGVHPMAPALKLRQCEDGQTIPTGMSELDLTTLFRFTCVYCNEQNELRHTHASHLRPKLISVKCSQCKSFNWLGWLPEVSDHEPHYTLTAQKTSH
jgi:hypothetical protein